MYKSKGKCKFKTFHNLPLTQKSGRAAFGFQFPETCQVCQHLFIQYFEKCCLHSFFGRLHFFINTPTFNLDLSLIQLIRRQSSTVHTHSQFGFESDSTNENSPFRFESVSTNEKTGFDCTVRMRRCWTCSVWTRTLSWTDWTQWSLVSRLIL